MSGEREPVEWQFRELRTPDPSKFLTVEGVVWSDLAEDCGPEDLGLWDDVCWWWLVLILVRREGPLHCWLSGQNCEEMINTDPLTLMSAVLRCVGRRGLLAFCPAPPAPPPSSGGRLMWGAGPLKVRTLKLIVNVLTFKFYPSEAVSCGAGWQRAQVL